MKRQAAVQRVEARRQPIKREWVRLVELQYTVELCLETPLDHIHHQPNTNLPPPSHNQILHQPPPLPPPHNHLFHQHPPLPQTGTTDPKSLLAEHLQLAPWPLHYREVPPPKYHGNTNPCKFLMCYEAAIASAGGDEAILTKSIIISLEDAAANWYTTLSPWCIYSRQ
jgi:hypothetical protein